MGKKSSQKKNKQKNSTSKPAQSAASQPRAGVTLQSLAGNGPAARVSAAASETREKAPQFGDQAEYVRGDIFRVTVLLVVMAVLLGGLTVANAKTSYLKDAGKRLSQFLQLQ